ncbi:MAG: dienelactone hydrolase family protein [Chloroflexota bacterium]|nr:dienelactone hydrolase family protein [Chloroflexota bacterium]
MGQMTRLQTSAGDTDAYLASARPAPGPPVLLLHPWWGLNQTIRDLADRLARDGFTVMAPDLFDGTILTTPDDAKAHVTSLTQADSDRMKARVLATLDHLVAHPDARGDRAAIIGLSFGAMEGTEVATGRPDVAALVTFYSGIFDAPNGIPYLGHFAEDDEFDDSAQVPDLQATLREGSSAHVYPSTHHWFAEPDRPEYNEEASELAYRRTVEFLRVNLA